MMSTDGSAEFHFDTRERMSAASITVAAPYRDRYEALALALRGPMPIPLTRSGSYPWWPIRLHWRSTRRSFYLSHQAQDRLTMILDLTNQVVSNLDIHDLTNETNSFPRVWALRRPRRMN
jgi:hypothetical protein